MSQMNMNRGLVLLILLSVKILVMHGATDSLDSRLKEYVSKSDPRIGVAVICGDLTYGVNEKDSFPMLSVYKLPIALALADARAQTGGSLNYEVEVDGTSLERDTWSPMLEKYGEVERALIPVPELLAYSLQMSDNNASDILLREVGGPRKVAQWLNEKGIHGVAVEFSEADMHADPARCYDNFSTPLDMARLIETLLFAPQDESVALIRNLMETCSTGRNRLSAPLLPLGYTVGHKTGTGFNLPDGRQMAINDVGYVKRPDGSHYVIAVFVADSHEDDEATEKIIADISAIVQSGLDAQRQNH